MDGQTNAPAQMPPLMDIIDRVHRIANALADLGDQLHQQANRVIGNTAVEPTAVPSPAAQKPEGGPLIDLPY